MSHWICPYCGREPFETPGPPQPTCCDDMLAQWRGNPPNGEALPLGRAVDEDDTAERIKELETAYAGERFRRAELETTLDEMMHALNMILPLARGYNAYQGTGCPESNRRRVKAAEIALRNADATIELCKNGAGP